MFADVEDKRIFGYVNSNPLCYIVKKRKIQTDLY